MNAGGLDTGGSLIEVDAAGCIAVSVIDSGWCGTRSNMGRLTQGGSLGLGA